MVRSVDDVDHVDHVGDQTSTTATVERLRRSGIRIDREGAFQHEGEPVLHEGLGRALYRWLDRLPDGRTILRLDDERFVYVDVDDTPLVARAARTHGVPPHAITLALSNGSEERLDPETLTIDAAGIMRCVVGNRGLAARLATSAATVVADLIDDCADGPVFMMAGLRFRLGRPTAVRP